MKKTLSMLMALCMIFALMTCTAVGAFAADDEIVTGSGTFTTKEAVERTIAWQECSNLAGKHEFYHSALEHRAELENIWVTEEPWTDTMSWTNNTQFMYGKEPFMTSTAASRPKRQTGSASRSLPMRWVSSSRPRTGKAPACCGTTCS